MTKKIQASPEENFPLEFVIHVVGTVQLHCVLNLVSQHDAVYVSGFRVIHIFVFDTRQMIVLGFIS